MQKHSRGPEPAQSCPLPISVCTHKLSRPVWGAQCLPALVLIIYLFITIFIVRRRVAIYSSYRARRHLKHLWGGLCGLSLVELGRGARCRVLWVGLWRVVMIGMWRWRFVRLIVTIGAVIGLWWWRRSSSCLAGKVVSSAGVVKASRSSTSVLRVREDI